MGEQVKLNLGAGATVIEGYVGLDIKQGQSAFPLDYADNSVDEVRASHLLEHFSHRETLPVLADWVRALKPGGLLKVAVPSFQWCIEQAGKPENKEPIEAYLMGGHVDANDYHKAIFAEQKLRNLMLMVGLADIEPWESAVPDCASMPVSLNLQGRKPATGATNPTPIYTAGRLPDKTACAVWSLPRLCFTDNLFTAFETFVPLGIGVMRHTGVFWGQCLTKCFEQVIDEGWKYIIAVDYDSVWDKENVIDLVNAMEQHPEFDAVAPVQVKREKNVPLMTVVDEGGVIREQVPVSEFADKEFVPLASAHFGLTIFRAEKVAALPKPWFVAVPNKDGEWKKDRLDEDMYFWHNWRKAGNTLQLANNIRIGHIQQGVTWMGKDFKVFFQYLNDYTTEGRPGEVTA